MVVSRQVGHVHTHVRTPTHIHTHTHIRPHTHAHTHIHAHTHMYTPTQVDELSGRAPEGDAAARALSTPRAAVQYREAPHAHTLRVETEALVQQLVGRQMDLAEALEEKVRGWCVLGVQGVGCRV